MPYDSTRGRKRGRKRKEEEEEVEPQPEQSPEHTHAERGRKRGSKRKIEAELPAMAHASTSTAHASAVVPAGVCPPTPGSIASRPPTPGLIRGRPPTHGLIRGRPPTHGLIRGRPPTHGLIRGRPPTHGLIRGRPPTHGLIRGRPPTHGLIRGRPPTPGLIRGRPPTRPRSRGPARGRARNPGPILIHTSPTTSGPFPPRPRHRHRFFAPRPATPPSTPSGTPPSTPSGTPPSTPPGTPPPTLDNASSPVPAPALAPIPEPAPVPAPASVPVPAPASVPVPAPASAPVPAPVPSTSDDYEYKYSSILPYLTSAANHDENMFSRAYVKPTASLSECLFADEDSSDFDIEVSEPESVDIRCSENVSSDLLPLKTTTSFEETINIYARPLSDLGEASREEDTGEKPGEGTSETVSNSSLARDDNSWRMPRTDCLVVRPGSPSLPMSEHEEAARMKELERKITEGEDVSVAEIRLYRRLKMRRVENEKNVKVFDPHVNYQSFWAMIETNTRMSLDRYLYDRYHFCQHDYLNSYRTRLQGSKESFYSSLSPYTKRILKPFILRDHETTPLWLRMMDEMLAKANKKNPSWVPSPKASIDYCNVRPHHLPAMNSLAEIYFWPGINLAECLRCPDFTCVVFYKKLLIGFTVASPDLFRNEVYISYMVVRREWQCSGIARVMLYHVIETCKGRDLTLHVSPTNPAVIVYQKFGFKLICFEKNFYARYLPPNSNQCRHAFFMRGEDLPKK